MSIITNTGKVKEIFANVNGEKKKIESAWAKVNGEVMKLFGTLGEGFVAVGLGDSYYSTDGQTWEAMSGSNTTSFYGVAFGKNVIVAVGTYNTTGRIYYSTDGKTWTKASGISSANYYGVTYANGKFIAVGASGTVSLSDDGKTWSNISVGTTDTLWNVTLINDLLFAGSSGKFFTSTDGIEWDVISFDSSYKFESIAYGNGMYVAIRNISNSYYSTDGKTWTKIAYDSTLGYVGGYAIKYFNNRFICIGRKEYYYSHDGITWYKESWLDEENYYYGLAVGKDILVAVGQNGSVAYSTDGVEWNKGTGLTSSITYKSVCFFNSND